MVLEPFPAVMRAFPEDARSGNRTLEAAGVME